MSLLSEESESSIQNKAPAEQGFNFYRVISLMTDLAGVEKNDRVLQIRVEHSLHPRPLLCYLRKVRVAIQGQTTLSHRRTTALKSSPVDEMVAEVHDGPVHTILQVEVKGRPRGVQADKQTLGHA